LTFKTLVNANTWCSKCEGYEQYDYQYPSKSQHVRTVLSDEVNDSKVVEDFYVSSKTVNIIKNISVGSDTPIIDNIHVSDSTSNDVNEIVEPNVPAMPSKSFKFPCVEYNFTIVPIESYSSESLEFFLSSFLVIWSLYLSPIYLHLRG